MSPELAVLRRLRQTNEVWQVYYGRGRGWVTPPGKPPERGYLLLIVSRDEDKVMSAHVMGDKMTSEQVLDALVTAIYSPAKGAGSPRRPRAVHCEDAALVQALATPLALLDIACEQQPTPYLHQVLNDLEQRLTGRKPLPGLLDSPGVTPEMVAGLFSAAAYYYREAPWRKLPDSEPLQVHHPPTARARYAVVMGHGKMAYGLAVYENWRDLQKIYQTPDAEKLFGQFNQSSVLFEPITSVPFADLDMLEKYDWEVASPKAYPVPIQFKGQRDRPLRPGVQEIGWFEAVLRTIPCFVKKHWRGKVGLLEPGDEILTVSVSGGEAQVRLVYPAQP